MKIRTQFFWFIAGIILIPILIGGIVILVGFWRMPERVLVPGYDEILEMSGSDIDEHDWKRISGWLNKMPPGIEFIIIDRNSTVVYSTVREAVSGSQMSDESLFSLIRDTGSRYMYQLDFSRRDVHQKVFTVTRVPRSKRYEPDKFTDVLTFVVILFFAVLVFCSVMLLLIARSITRSVMMLEEATKRIASGRLDEEVTVTGSNEITSLTISLNKMRLSLQEDQKRRSRFIMGVSHDLRTPLALIKGYSEALFDGVIDDPEERSKSYGIITAKISQLEEMIDDLINFVKLDTGEWRRHLTAVHLAPILRGYTKRLEADANLLGRTVSVNIDIPDSVKTALDERLFLRLLENICGNALRYTGAGGHVDFSAYLSNRKECTFADSMPAGRIAGGRTPDGYTAAQQSVVISIRDNGCGIDEGDMPFIFDPFYRGSNSRREEGSGLGLSVVKSIVNSHGWTIDVSSRKNEGTEFTVVIPVYSEE